MKTIFLSLVILFFCISTVEASETFGTYLKVIENAGGSFDELSSAVESGLKSRGWEIVGTFDTGTEGCTFRSHVVVFSSGDYAASVMANGVKAAFALPLRAGVYEDESGMHVAVVNPASINRTIVHETALSDFSLSQANSIADAIANAVSGTAVSKQMGQMRKRGRIGGMGGGDFVNKIEALYTADDDSDATFRQVAASVEKGIRNNKKEWELAYTYDLSSHNAIVFGVRKSRMEAKAFTIAGEKRASGSYKCPGIDHGAAFPIEVVVYKDGGKVKVVTLDGMYRMKLYFEDAGMWAFMKNMSMPGEIEDEILEMSTAELKK